MNTLPDYRRDQRLILDSLERLDGAMQRLGDQLASAHTRIIEMGADRKHDAQRISALENAVRLSGDTMASMAHRIAALEQKEDARSGSEKDERVQGRWDKLTQTLLMLAAGAGGGGIVQGLTALGG